MRDRLSAFLFQLLEHRLHGYLAALPLRVDDDLRRRVAALEHEKAEWAQQVAELRQAVAALSAAPAPKPVRAPRAAKSAA